MDRETTIFDVKVEKKEKKGNYPIVDSLKYNMACLPLATPLISLMIKDYNIDLHQTFHCITWFLHKKDIFMHISK